MSKNGYISKGDFLGVSYGTAQNKLKKLIMFDLLKQQGNNICYRCGKEIETADELSIEHKKAWFNISIELFWNLDNVAFSHFTCNSGNHVIGAERDKKTGRFRSSA